MHEESEEKRLLNKEISKQQELEKERVEIAKKIINNLKKQKKIEKEHLDLVEQHQKYWNKELGETKIDERERYDELKDKLKMEEKICKKIKENIRNLDKEIEFQKIHAKNHLS